MPRPSRSSEPRTAPPPLDQAGLERLALHYVGRYATTRMRLVGYLRRKLRERGADGVVDADAVAARMAALGYVDDAAFAAGRAASLGRRGYGARRISQALNAAGIDSEVQEGIAPAIEEDARAAVLRFARRRRLGPFAAQRAEGPDRAKAIGALARAGHPLDLVRAIVDAGPGESPFEED